MLATLQVLVCALLVVWAAMVRFGPRRAAPPPIAPGKDFLIRNTAALLHYGGHHGARAAPLPRASRARRCATRCTRPTLTPSAIDRVARAGARRARRHDLARRARARRRDAAGDRARPRVVELADQVYRWRQEMTPWISTTIRDLAARLREQVHRVVVGQDHAIDLLLVALLCEGHVLFEGVPGVAKTLLARTFASGLSLQFGRVQFTPDLMPGDIIGTNLFNFQTNSFTLTKGPIFTELLLADEINRTPPKTQAALLAGDAGARGHRRRHRPTSSATASW